MSACVVALGAVLALVGIDPLASASVIVTSNPVWTDTGLDVTTGQTLAVTATGSWTVHAPDPPYGPDGVGVPCSTNCNDIFLVTAYQGALIGFIGTAGLTDASFRAQPQNTGYFDVGSAFTTTVTTSGRLYLGFNDAYTSANHAADNSGTVSATVAIDGAVIASANPPWTDSGIDVTAGHLLQISAVGSWTFHTPSVPLFGPDGDGCVSPSCEAGSYLTTAARGALVAFIGTPGLAASVFETMPQSVGYFKVGSSFSGSAPASGRLYLGFNADRGGSAGAKSDNVGSVSASIFFPPDSGAAAGPTQGGDGTQPGLGTHGNGTTGTQGGVNSLTGSFYTAALDIELSNGSGLPTFRFVRSYNSSDAAGAHGQGWTASYEDTITANSDGTLVFHADDGQQLLLSPQGGGTYGAPGVFSNVSATGSGYTLLRRDQVRYTFDAQGRLLTESDPNGNTVRLSRDGNGTLTSLTDAAGHVVAVTTDSVTGRITSLRLPDGRTVAYTYVGSLLSAVQGLDGKTATYQYDAAGRLTAEVDELGNAPVAVRYGSGGRVTDVLSTLVGHTTFGWDPATQTSTQTDPGGEIWQDVYDGSHLVQSTVPSDTLEAATSRAMSAARGAASGNSLGITYDAAGNVVSRTDARGNTTTFTYDDYGNLLTRTAPAPLSYVDSYTYDAANRLLTHTDPRGATTANSYDASGNLSSTIFPDGSSVSYQYNGRGQQTSSTDANSHVTHYEYDGAGNLTRRVSPLGYAVVTTYDALGQKTSQVEPRGNEPANNPDDYRTTYTYDALDRLISSTDPLGHVTASAYDDAGHLVSETDPTGAVTRYIYDDQSRLTRTIFPDGGQQATEYDSFGRVARVTDPLGHATTYTYDAQGQLASMVTARGNEGGANPSNFEWRSTYDENGNVLTTADPDGGMTTNSYDVLNRLIAVTDPLGRTTSYAYDAAGNRTSVTDALGHTTETSYDLLGRISSVTDATGRMTLYTYDAGGNRTAITSPGGNVTTFGYDADNRLVTMVDGRGNLAGATPGSFTTVYGYDAGGHRTTVMDPNGNATQYTFDRAGRRVGINDANGHATGFSYDPTNRLTGVVGPDGASTAYTYDAMGNTLSRTDGNGHVTTYSYDMGQNLVGKVSPLNRQWANAYDAEGHLASMVDPRAGGAVDPSIGTVHYAYDAIGRLVGIDYGDTTPDVALAINPDGEVAAMSDGQGVSGIETYDWDPAGRLVGSTRDARALTYQYDAVGRVTRRTIPTGSPKKPFVEDVTYDTEGLLAGISVNGLSIARNSYDAAGHLTSQRFANGVIETREYDPAGRLTEITDTSPDTVTILARWSYAYDAVGNPVAVTAQSGGEQYSYDTASRLVSVCYSAACTEPGSFIRYTYDNVGNRLTEVRSTGTTAYTYDADDELQSVTSPSTQVPVSYDPAGNQTGVGGTTYRYDLANRLIGVTVGKKGFDYAYDGNGKWLTVSRHGVARPTSRFLWDAVEAPPKLRLISSGSGAEQQRLIYGSDPIATGKGTSKPNFLHTDALGSVRLLTTLAGRSGGVEAFEPFGAVRGKASGKLKKGALRFTGEYFDANAGLYHLRARDYDPATGRFLNPDSVAQPIDQASAASYAYVQNRPTVLTDPTGKVPGPRTRAGSLVYWSAVGTHDLAKKTGDWLRSWSWYNEDSHAPGPTTKMTDKAGVDASKGVAQWVEEKLGPFSGGCIVCPDGGWAGVLTDTSSRYGLDHHKCYYRWLVDEMYYGAGHTRCLVVGHPSLTIGTKAWINSNHGDKNCWYSNKNASH